MEREDQRIFNVTTPGVASILVDTRTNSKNQISNLLITKDQRQQLLSALTAGFGDKLNQKEPINHVVGSAVLLTAFLTKQGFKCADEPWE
jgi:hypothetical protein